MSKNEHFPVPSGATLVCNAPGCEYVAFVGLPAINRGAASDVPFSEYFGHLWRGHAHQYEPGSAPDISVEWELVATCSVCPEGGDMSHDGDGVHCETCGAHWNDRGEYGETDEVELEVIRDRDHEEALDRVEWLVAGRDRKGHIRMRGGRGEIVGTADDTRANVEAWIGRSRPGRYRDMYRAALELLDREAAERTREVALEREISGEAESDVQRVGRAAAAAEDKRLREAGE